MGVSNVLVRGPHGDEAGVVRIPSHYLDKMIVGHRVRVGFEEILTAAGASIRPELIGSRHTGRERLELEAQPNAFGRGAKWAYFTNEFGEAVIRRICDAEDAELFRFWIDQAALRPSAVASFLAGCSTKGEYRAALLNMRRAAGGGSKLTASRG